MTYLIGTDEAGYGPNLGPLVISTSVWRLDRDSDEPHELYNLLRDVVASEPPHDRQDDERLVIADSKALYKPGKGLSGLERGVLTTLAATGRCPRRWQSIWPCLQADPDDQRQGLPWYADYDCELPVEVLPGEIELRAESLVAGLRRVNVELVDVRSRAVFPEHFNRLITTYGNKASALSQVTLQLVKAVMAQVSDGQPVTVICDKHGGRNKYRQLLQQVFTDTLVMIRKESRAESIYHMGSESHQREIRFCAGGESFLPSALASMVSKYVRELAMKAFNRFWQERVGDLRPTAGYPVDARRFKQDIAATQEALAIADNTLWRAR